MNYKLFFNVFLFIFLNYNVYSQEYDILNSSNTNAICNVNNYLKVSYAKKSDVKNIFLKTNNGVIKKEIEYYNWIPEFKGKSEILMYRIKGKDTIYMMKKTFIVNEIKVLINFPYVENNKIKKENLLNVNGIYHYFSENMNFSGNYRIQQFSFFVLRKDTLIYSKTNYSMNFSLEDKKIFKTLKEFDKIVICNAIIYSKNIMFYPDPIEIIVIP
ncbi:MAG: hypothetical protein BWY22_01530 [Bacteroidetes bacterium ADurb.Bin217]|nr:MAG: hypothetical protein BWY22_01530 [Bacteroidetes bacterium ADurb.Bin217]